MRFEKPFQPPRSLNPDTGAFVERVLGKAQANKLRMLLDEKKLEMGPSFEIADFTHEAGQSIFEQKLDEQLAKDMLAEGDKYLAILEQKQNKGEPLSRAELFFLYEIFGRIITETSDRSLISKIRSQRNSKEDAPIVFECEPGDIAWKKEDIDERTKAYIGPLFPGVFSPYVHLGHVYTSFPEGKITKQTIKIGGRSIEQLEEELNKAGCDVGRHALNMMQQKEFITAKNPEQADLMRLRVGDLFGDQNAHATADIYQKADQLGLELCPAEVGPHLLLAYKDQPMGEWVWIAMKQITGPDCRPSILRVGYGGLAGEFADPSRKWDPEYEFVFRYRK